MESSKPEAAGDSQSNENLAALALSGLPLLEIVKLTGVPAAYAEEFLRGFWQGMVHGAAAILRDPQIPEDPLTVLVDEAGMPREVAAALGEVNDGIRPLSRLSVKRLARAWRDKVASDYTPSAAQGEAVLEYPDVQSFIDGFEDLLLAPGDRKNIVIQGYAQFQIAPLPTKKLTRAAP